LTRRRWIVACLAWAPGLLLATASHAALTVTVSPGAPSGQSVWTFSGSSIYNQQNPGGKFAAGGLALIQEWKGDSGSDYVKTGAYNNHVADLSSGSIDIVVTPLSGSPLSGNIDGLHIDHDTSGDDFGVSLLGTVDIPLAAGDTVSWSGSGIFPVDLAKLNLGSFLFSKYGEDPLGQPYGILPINMVVSVPGPLPLLGCGAAFTFSRRLRRACLQRRLKAADPIASEPQQQP
jgi:hypothetical protein